jgi:PEP-CTERM motif
MTIKLASGIAAPRKTNLLIMSIAAGVLGLSGAASAEIVTATFTGPVIFVLNPDGGLPPASEGDAFVATYVFNLANATDTLIDPTTGGFSSGPYGSFVTATVSVNGTTGALPAFTTGELTGETQVFDTGSVIDAVVSGGANHLDSNITGTDFAWNLASPAHGFSYDPTDADQTLIQLGDTNGDLVEADISSVAITVSSTPPVPEPSTWAMMLLGFAGLGFASYRARKRGLLAI